MVLELKMHGFCETIAMHDVNRQSDEQSNSEDARIQKDRGIGFYELMWTNNTYDEVQQYMADDLQKVLIAGTKHTWPLVNWHWF